MILSRFGSSLNRYLSQEFRRLRNPDNLILDGVRCIDNAAVIAGKYASSSSSTKPEDPMAALRLVQIYPSKVRDSYLFLLRSLRCRRVAARAG